MSLQICDDTQISVIDNSFSFRDVRLSPQEVAAVDGLYRIRVPRVFLQADRQPERQMEGYLTAFVRAVCTLYNRHTQNLRVETEVLLLLFKSQSKFSTLLDSQPAVLPFSTVLTKTNRSFSNIQCDKCGSY